MEFLKCLLTRARKPKKKKKKQDVAATTANNSQISRYGWMQPTCMHSVSFLGKVTSGSCKSASRSDLLKLPNKPMQRHFYRPVYF